MSQKTISKNFTTGSIPRQMFFFMLPFMLSNAMQVLYSTIDMIIVDRFVGTAGVSAVGQSSQIVNFATMVCLGFSNAGQVLLAQALGANKKKEMNSIMGTLFSLIIILSLVLSITVFVFCSPILNIMNIPSVSYDMSMTYMLICGAGLIFTAGYNMVSAVLRGLGDSKRPFLFIAIASVTNLVLDLLFTGLFGWGVAGAALATVIGQAVSFLFSIYYLVKHKSAFGFNFKKQSFKINPQYAKMMLYIGAPMAIQSGCINISMLFVNSMINSVGVVASATFSAGIKIDDIINKISQGIHHAAMPMISQNIGADNTNRAKRIVYCAWVFSGIWTVVFIAAYILFGKQMFMLFSSDPAVHKLSATFIKAILWMFPALALMRGTGALIQGIGNAKLSMVLALLDGVILRIGLSWLFGVVFDLGFYGYVLGYAVAPYGYAIPGVIYFLSGLWKKHRRIAEDI
ncbi:MAG: MATE family efflux transporter [Clostridia bacterium]|nr:MATE family efflux transporter [Clostridia bacterium]